MIQKYKLVGKISAGGFFKGDDGKTPYIGANGNWWIGDEDTGVRAGYMGPVIPKGILYGDANGDGEVNAKDSRLILQYLGGEITKGELRLEVADVNADGVVDETDAELIEQYAADLTADFAAGKYVNWLEDGEYYYYDLIVGGITEGMAVSLLAPGVEIVRTECYDGYIRLYVVEPPREDAPYGLHFDNGGSANQDAVAHISVTEAADGSVTMVNTLENGGTETIVIGADENGNPNKVTYNGKEIPIDWVVSA